MMSVSILHCEKRVPAALRLPALATCRDAAALELPNELAAVVRMQRYCCCLLTSAEREFCEPCLNLSVSLSARIYSIFFSQ